MFQNDTHSQPVGKLMSRGKEHNAPLPLTLYLISHGNFKGSVKGCFFHVPLYSIGCGWIVSKCFCAHTSSVCRTCNIRCGTLNKIWAMFALGLCALSNLTNVIPLANIFDIQKCKLCKTCTAQRNSTKLLKPWRVETLDNFCQLKGQ